MTDVEQAFTLAVQRWRIRAWDKHPQPDLFPELLGRVDEPSARCSQYLSRAMATNLDSDQFTDHQMVQFYNQRAATSENRIKALRSDFAAAQPPCGEFDAHAVDFQFGAIVCNLLALMRLMLPAAWESCRTPTIRYRLYALAGQIVGPSRPLMRNIDRPRTKQFEEALWSIRPCVLR